MVRVALGTMAVIAVLGGLTSWLVWQALPPSGLRLHVADLSAPVLITLDPDGIPRILAATEEDGATALGFMHARDRLFQMDLMRRAASGRLSEIAGAATLPLDRSMRMLGLRVRAAEDAAALDDDTRAMLGAYARGVNAWIARRGRFSAPEFVALGAPEPWTITDSLLWGKTMALYLSGSWRWELARAAMLVRLPPARVRALFPAESGIDHAGDPRPSDPRLSDPRLKVNRLAALVPDFPAPFTLPATASNEWAVAGSHTVTGAPLLAGDPHLAFGFPSIWYLARIDVPGHVLAGATAPGVPFLVMGHNSSVAWTFTTTGADTQDVFIETPLPDGRYETPDGPRALVARTETIHVRGSPDEVLTVHTTRHGPVLSDLDRTASSPMLAVSMAGLIAPDTAASGLLALNRADTLDDVAAASELISAPVQNLLAADRLAIGRYTTGRVPLRRAGDGTVPVDGADGAHDWTGLAGGAALPRVTAPADGQLVNANERVAGPDFPVFLGADWFGDWRARRIRTLLEQSAAHTVQSFAAMQMDATSSFALQVLPGLLATVPVDDASQRALDVLMGWDGEMSPASAQPLIFNAWMRQFEALILTEAGVPPGLAGARSDVIARALSPAGAAWCNGDCGPLLSGSLQSAVAGIIATRGTAPRNWLWGSVHQAIFAHPLLGMLPVIGPLTTWKIAQGGDETTVNRGGMRGDSWASVHGAGYRGVYDLFDLDRSLFALTPGQSGNPLRASAGSLMERWRDGTSITLGPRAAAVADTVRLTP